MWGKRDSGPKETKSSLLPSPLSNPRQEKKERKRERNRMCMKDTREISYRHCM